MIILGALYFLVVASTMLSEQPTAVTSKTLANWIFYGVARIAGGLGILRYTNRN